MFRGNKHPFTHSRVDNYVTGKSKLEKVTTTTQPNLSSSSGFAMFRFLPPKCHPSFVADDPELHKSIKGYHYAQRNSKPTSHQGTNAQLKSKSKLASLTSAKRSVVTSDAARTHSPSPKIHSEFIADAQRAVEHKTN
jgi:hypothetical protein